MKEMVVGFPFADYDLVYLIRKNRPNWQKGKLNGIGGHVEPGESSLEAMIRECKEETGKEIKDWKYVCTMSGKDWNVYVFTVEIPLFDRLKTVTDEEVECHSMHRLYFEDTIPNTQFLVPMCRDCLDNPHTFKSAVFKY